MMLPFLLSQLAGQSGEGIVDLCLDHKLIGDWHPEKFTSIEGLGLFPDLRIFSAGMQALTETVGLAEAPMIEDLDLNLNEISDISGINSLKNLKRLILSHNEISSLEGIDWPKSLQELDLGFNQISDIFSLNGLNALVVLVLNGNRRLTHLEGLPTGLRELHLNQCFVHEYSKLVDLPALETLSVSPGGVQGLASLGGLQQLKTLKLNASRLAVAVNLPPLPGLQTLRIHKALQVCAFTGFDRLPHLSHLEINHSLLESTPPLLGCPSLKVLEIKFSPLKNLNGLAELQQLERLVLTGSPVPGKAIAALQAALPDLEIQI